MIDDNIEADILGAQAVGIPAILVRKEDARATYAYLDLSLIPGFLSQDRTFSKGKTCNHHL